MARHRKWTAEDEAALRNLVARGFYMRQLSLRLRRSESSVKKHARDLSITVKPTPRSGSRSNHRASYY